MATVDLRYAGGDVSAQEGMDAYFAADAINGFAEFIEALTESAYGRDVRAKLVKGQLRTTHIIEEVLGHEPYQGGQSSFV